MLRKQRDDATAMVDKMTAERGEKLEKDVRIEEEKDEPEAKQMQHPDKVPLVAISVPDDNVTDNNVPDDDHIVNVNDSYNNYCVPDPDAADDGDESSESSSASDDDVKSIEWVASTVSTTPRSNARSKPSQVMKLITERPRTQIESPKPRRQIIQVASPKRKNVTCSPKKNKSPNRMSPSRNGPPGPAELLPASPPIPPKPKRINKEAKEVKENLAVPSPPKKGLTEEMPSPTPLPFVLVAKKTDAVPAVTTSEVETYGHLIVTSELQAKYSREQTPERKKKKKKKATGIVAATAKIAVRKILK